MMMLGDNLHRKHQILVAGHMGYKGKCPENTLVSYRTALEAGVDLIELDLNLTKDGELVCIHDNKVNRTTDGQGYVHDLTLEEIKSLDAGSKFSPQFAGERIPTFREFLDLVANDSNLLLNVEIKEKTFETVDLAVKLLKEYKYLNRCVIACFDASIIKYAHDTYKVRTQGFPDDLQKNLETGRYGTRSIMYSVGIPSERLTPGLAEAYLHEGIKPWAWLVDDIPTAEACIRAGVLVVTSNFPDIPLQYFRQQGWHK